MRWDDDVKIQTSNSKLESPKLSKAFWNFEFTFVNLHFFLHKQYNNAV